MQSAGNKHLIFFFSTQVQRQFLSLIFYICYSLLKANYFIQILIYILGSWPVLHLLRLVFSLIAILSNFFHVFFLDYSPQTFGIPLFQVIANDRAYKQLQETVKSSRRQCLEVEATVTNFRAQMQKRSQLGRSCWLVPYEIFPEEPLSPAFPDHSSSWSQRRVRLQKWTKFSGRHVMIVL